MPKTCLPKQQSFYRAALLMGVLAGLLFSCGEGVRLLPFPAAENTTSQFKSGGDINYQKNLHRFENNAGKYQSKLQRDNLKHYRTDASHALPPAPFSAS